MDEETGLPIVWIQTPFGDDISSHTNYVVPNEYRKYLKQTGEHFKKYIHHLRAYVVDADIFLRTYPRWEDIKIHTEQWTQREHNEFKKALEWFASKDAFILEWSY